jgi:hypothetical protein
MYGFLTHPNPNVILAVCYVRYGGTLLSFLIGLFYLAVSRGFYL